MALEVGCQRLSHCRQEPPREQGREEEKQQARAAGPGRPELRFPGILEKECGFVQRVSHFPHDSHPIPRNRPHQKRITAI